MSDARRPRHEAQDGDDSSSNWRELYAALNSDPARPSRRRRRAAEDEPEESEDPAEEPAEQAESADQAEPADGEQAAGEPVPAAAPGEPDGSAADAGSGEPPRRGRHSAPDDDDDDEADQQAAPEQDDYRPRRWRPDTDEVPTQGDDRPTPQDVTEPTPQEAAPEMGAAGESADESVNVAQQPPGTPWPPHLTGPEFGEPEPQDPQHTGPAAAGSYDAQAEQDGAPGSPAQSTAPGPPNPAATGPAGPAGEPASDAQQAQRPRSRHAAEGERTRVPVWLIAVVGAVVVALLVWLIVGLTGGDDDSAAPPSSASASSSASPTSMNIAQLQPILCTGQSYAFIDTGLSDDEMLADPGALDAQYPDAQLATVPGGCIEGSTTADDVVLALGPFNSLEETCAAVREISGAQYTVYTGSANIGLAEATCP